MILTHKSEYFEQEIKLTEENLKTIKDCYSSHCDDHEITNYVSIELMKNNSEVLENTMITVYQVYDNHIEGIEIEGF